MTETKPLLYSKKIPSALGMTGGEFERLVNDNNGVIISEDKASTYKAIQQGRCPEKKRTVPAASFIKQKEISRVHLHARMGHFATAFPRYSSMYPAPPWKRNSTGTF